MLTLCLLLPLAAQADDQSFGDWTLTTVDDDAYATFMSLQQDSSTAIKDENAAKDGVPRLLPAPVRSCLMVGESERLLPEFG